MLLYEFKKGVRATVTGWNINDAFGPETVNEWIVFHKVSRWVIRTWKMKNGPIDHQILRWRVEISNWGKHRDNDKEYRKASLWMIRHLRQIGKVIKLSEWVAHELNEKWQYRCFEVSPSFILGNKNDTLLIGLRLAMTNEYFTTTETIPM